MPAVTYEGIVENGKVKLAAEVQLPEHAKVYLVVTEEPPTRVVRMMSPRLANPADAALFKKTVRKKEADTSIPPPTQ